MRRCLIPSALVIACAVCLAIPALAQEVIPPEERDTIEAAPKVEAAGQGRTQAEEEHTVIPGDTLWDLCQKYLSNPWYWPRVWSYNTEISNPHWIFPGQIVRFYPSGELPGEIDTLVNRDFEVPEPVDMEDEEEQLAAGDLVQMSGKGPVQAKRATAVMLRRDAFVTPEELKEIGVVRASPQEQEFLAELNKIYIEAENPGAFQVGQQYSIFRTEAEINHPITGDFVGYYIKILGTCQVVGVGEESATALISTSVEPIIRGDRVGPLFDELTKMVAPRANGVELRGYIIGSRVNFLSMLGEEHLVFIDQGSKAGVQEGNVFDIVRREDAMYLPGQQREEGRWDKGLPPEIWGRVMVIDARETASTGVVIASLREIRIGDRVLMSVQ